MEDQNQNNSFNLNSAAPSPIPQSNPLNTGNDTENQAHEIPLAPQPPVSTIINNAPPSAETNFKKYIIITIVAVLLLGGGAIAYFMFFSEEENPGLNTLSSSEEPENSAKMEELENVVEDLKDVYSDQADSSAPPTITIDLSEEETITEEIPGENLSTKKIPR